MEDAGEHRGGRGRRARLPLGVAVAAAGLLGSPAAWAFDLWGTGPLANSSVQVSSNFELRYHHVPEKLELFEDRNILDYWEQVGRVNLLLSKEGLAIGAQVDEVALFGNRYILDGVEYQERPLYDPDILSPWDDALVRMEKLFLTQRWEHVELTVGDTYASFGHGIALNIVKNTNIDIDTSIRGAKVALYGGDVELNVVTGLSNTQDISQFYPNQLITFDVPHMVTGARVAHYGVGPAQVGMHGVIYRFGRAADRDTPALVRYEQDLDAVVSGADVAVNALGIDWHVEGDLFGYRSPELAGIGEDDRLGYAVYGSAAAYPGKATLLVEAKRTRDTERLNAFTTPEGWEVAQVPTLEYELTITEDASAVVNSNDVYGGRVRLDYAVRPAELVPYVSFAGFRDNDLGGLHFNRSPESIGHGIAGLQWFKGRGVVQLNGGYRVDVRDLVEHGMDRMAHLDAEIQVPVGPEDGIELAVNGRRFWWGDNEIQQHDFLEMNNALGWHRGDKWVFLVYQDFTDNPIITSEGNLSDDLYGAVEVIWHPKPSSTVRAFYGAYKAGIRCSGGQCRSLPGFEGGRLSWQTVF